MTHPLINTSPLFVHRDKSISEAVRMMIDQRASSVLIHDDMSRIVGILTERDIVRKFTLLDLDQKWGKTVGTIMSRPVVFVRLDHLEEDLFHNHFVNRLRHFPVKGSGPETIANTVGIVTTTDLCREYLRLQKAARDAAPEPTLTAKGPS